MCDGLGPAARERGVRQGRVATSATCVQQSRIIETKEGGFMGRVSAFLGMVLYMYPEKNGRHNRPHVHVLYGDDESR